MARDRRTLLVVLGAVAVFAAALGLALGNYALRFARWEALLRSRGIAVPTGRSALVFVSGFALAVTPGKLGELVKSYLLRRLHAVPVARSAPVVIAERVADLLALLVLSVAGVAAYGVAVELVVAAGLAIAAGLVVLASPALGRRLGRLLTRPRPLRRFAPKVDELVDGLAALSRPAILTASTALSVAAWSLECVGFALIVDAFPGADVPTGLAMFIYAATTIAGALSFLPGGLGVTEGAMTLLLVHGASGLDPATAAAATILTRLATLWFAVVLGLAAMAVARRLPGASEAAGPDGPAILPP